jgi:hypothetical protein
LARREPLRIGHVGPTLLSLRTSQAYRMTIR